MSKYNYEFKKKIVLEYLAGVGSFAFLAKKYGIPSPTRIYEWVDAYQKLGDKGIHRSRQQKKYSFEYKLHMVELYLSSEVSYQELALQEGISNSCLLVKWVNDYRIAGPDALRPKMKGRKKSVNTKKSENPTNISSVDTSVEKVKQLEEELLKLRIENAFLKELRRLRLEEEAKMRDLRKSSVASEENSN